MRGLTKHYVSRSGVWGGREHVVRAVDDVSFQVRERETFGLVGESGCGKTTVARMISGLLPPTSGAVSFLGRDVHLRPTPMEPWENALAYVIGGLPFLISQGLVREATERLRHRRELARNLQIVFQDPYSSLDPRMTIRATLLEPLEIHRVGSKAEREARVRELLEMVGLPESALGRYPHEFSGGQRQRIGIARALALSPRLVVADEPVSALDLSIRAQVINLLADLQAQLGLAYLLIAHDLTLVRHVCHRVAVMHAGKIVEVGETEALFRNPQHPYTRSLLEAIPVPDPRLRDRHRTSIPAEAEAQTGATGTGAP